MKILISTLLMFIASISVAQRNLSDKIKSKVNNKEFFSKYSFFQSEKVLNNQKLGGNYTEFILDDIQLNKFLKDQPLQFELTITGLSQNYSLKLIRSNIIDVSTIFNVIDKDGNSAEFKYMAPLFYQGVIGDVQQNSFVTASISKTGGIRIFISVNHQNIKVSKIKDNADTNVYGCFEHLPGNNEAFNFECGTRGENFNINNQQLDTAPLSTLSYGSKVIRCFFDCAFTYYQQNGSSVQNTIDRITDLFNQSALCYANESVNISISQITVYTSPDPFNHANRNVGLSSFKNTVQNAWVGNVAMLCDWTASINSGLADGIGVLCNNFPAAAGHYIYNDLNYNNSFSNFPVAADAPDVYLIIHEMGHIFGSAHTQNCGWPGGAIDNCAATEGGCAGGPTPVSGTMMSYCCTNPAIRIDFNNGFGPLPGNAIRNHINGANCVGNGTGTCDPTLYLVNGIYNIDYTKFEVSNILTGACYINSSANVVLDAGRKVILKLGFKATIGSNVKVVIDGCGGVF